MPTVAGTKRREFLGTPEGSARNPPETNVKMRYRAAHFERKNAADPKELELDSSAPRLLYGNAIPNLFIFRQSVLLSTPSD